MKKIIVAIGLSLVSFGSLFSQTKIYNLPLNIGTTWDWLPTTQGLNTVKINPSSLWLGIPFAIKDEGINVVGSGATSINFTGAGVTTTQISNAVTVNIPSSGGGGSAVTTTYATQTANYTLADYTATDGVCQDWVITGNNTNTISFPTGNAADNTPKWVNGNGVATDNTKVNYIYTCAKNGHIIYNTIKLPLPATPDVTAPTYAVQTVTGITSTTAAFNAQINEAGQVRWMITTSASAPSTAAIDAGTGAVGSNFGILTMVANTTNSTAVISGLTVSTNYYLWSYARDAVPNSTAVQAGINFATTAGGAIVQDLFTSANLTDLAGRVTPTGAKTWLKTGAGIGTIGIVSNAIKNTGVQANLDNLYYFNASVRNCEIIVTVGAGGTAGYSNIEFASSSPTTPNSNNRYFFTSANLLRKQIGATATTLFTGTGQWAAGQTIRIVLNASTVTVYQTLSGGSETQLYSGASDATITGTNVGLYIYDDNTSTINDITVN